MEDIEVPQWEWGSVILTLHTFCDPSNTAYAAAVVLCVVTANKLFVMLVRAKTRVLQMKKATIQCLELLVLLIGARLIHFVLKEIKNTQKMFLWSN